MIYDEIGDLIKQCLKKTLGNSHERDTMVMELEYIEWAYHKKPNVWKEKVQAFLEAA
jgi:hypothetical protein